MQAACQIQCPNCRNILRVPFGLANVAVKCKFCAQMLLLKAKSARLAGHLNGAFNGLMPAQPAQPYSNGYVAAPPNGAAHLPFGSPLPEVTPAYSSPVVESPGRYGRRRGGYKGPRQNNSARWIIVGICVVLSAGFFTTILLRPDWFKANNTGPAKPAEVAKGNDARPKDGPKTAEPEGTQPLPPNQTGPFPRRLLAIAISEYIYANGLQYGVSTAGRDFFKAVDYLATGWHIPKEQTYFVTDGPVGGKVDSLHPPLKMVVNGTIDAFVSSCRPQDRIVIIFSGHAIEKDGEAYLVPIEGELEDVASLIPLKEFYAKLSVCPAQEKLVIFDVCRFDPQRGIERPAFGMMTEALEKALHECPDGVTVWTSCSAGQYAYEYRDADVSIGEIRDLYGSVFFGVFFGGNNRQQLFSHRQEGKGIPHPADSLPIGPVSEYVTEKTETVVKFLQNKAQTPKLTSKARKEWRPYDPNEPLAAKIELTNPPRTANREEIAAMFREIELPGIKEAVKLDEGSSVKLAASFPFTKEQLSGYEDSGPTFDEIAKNPAKYAKEYPLRAATVEAITEMRKLRHTGMQLREEFRSPINDGTKKDITDNVQKIIATRQSILDELKDNLEAANKKRETEKSKRWLANFDYAYAQVRVRLAYVFEYNAALGKVKTGQLPELDMAKNQTGWRLASVEKMGSPKDIRDLADEAKNSFAELAKANPHTPWTVMGKSQKNTTLGLKWEPSNFEKQSDK